MFVEESVRERREMNGKEQVNNEMVEEAAIECNRLRE